MVENTMWPGVKAVYSLISLKTQQTIFDFPEMIDNTNMTGEDSPLSQHNWEP